MYRNLIWQWVETFIDGIGAWNRAEGLVAFDAGVYLINTKLIIRSTYILIG